LRPTKPFIEGNNEEYVIFNDNYNNNNDDDNNNKKKQKKKINKEEKWRIFLLFTYEQKFAFLPVVESV
jgi:hypothetical protein